jgi:hypothetical protein
MFRLSRQETLAAIAGAQQSARVTPPRAAAAPPPRTPVTPPAGAQDDGAWKEF